mmetsp:Transcript_23291/g.59539  ORF Transcript_23291/g.59539 Transcript_23291/m.59539 type:complete len:89 (-) Transcript_23291:920-1186(-)|eukprot:CAMPEP_0202868382 /NCGR_PEP_ID=MMETSP1391-20130828/10846_1 /ASSEMBLY_ACC=CAM_ASM_000867 /TAXON_ID=1034604 /ORGANISM="Chlamydomonas leiostraca, Strain SAG 11-49" /LENGTH=88 /DNA_ID=CAMNT_0049548547 /DNA_START=109 /DNA_END=375 /DNA_ORIENTATION=+
MAHQCDHRCVIEHCFGNVFKCASSGMQHVCDCNCDQRVYYDNYHSICKLSRKLHPPLESEMVADIMRKRSADGGFGERAKRAACMGTA